MKISEFEAIFGKKRFVKCRGKVRIDKNLCTRHEAVQHLRNGGQVGWWISPGYIVVDIDEGRPQALKALKALGIKTMMMKTPKGVHLVFKTDKEFPQKTSMVLPCGLKCDFRCADKGYIVLPWNSGKTRHFSKCKEVAPLPLEFTPLLDRKESLLNMSDGDGRNNALFGHLMAYKNAGASRKQIAKMARIINSTVFAEPLSDDELHKIVNSTKKYKAKEPEQDEDTRNPYLLYNKEGGAVGVNARAIVDSFVEEGLVFVLGGEAYYYENGVYTPQSSKVRQQIQEKIGMDKYITAPRIMEIFRLLIDDVRLQKTDDELNPNKKLINFKNGVWDIEKGELLPHSPAYFQTLQIPHKVGKYVKFKDTHFFDFVKKAGLSKTDIKMILNFMAYSLTLENGLKSFMVLFGQSNTGKSVLLRFIEGLVGKCNTSALSMHELSQRFYPAQLHNTLLNSCGDNGSLPLSSIENLKKITGGDPIMHEHKGKEPFFFTPFCKLIFSFNQLPLQLEEKSNAFYERMRILYMNRELKLSEDYVTELWAESSIEELIPYLLKRLPVKEIPHTQTSDQNVEHLRRDSDSLYAFISDACTREAGSTVSKDDLYNSYVEYCIDNGRESMKKHNFMRSLRSMGVMEDRRRIGKGKREGYYIGIGLK